VSKIRVGVIGAGTIASSLHIPVLRAVDEIELSWIYDVNIALANTVARAHNIQSLQNDPYASLNSVDAILLAIPVPPRGAYLDKAKGTALGVLVEKPLACSISEHRAIIDFFPPWQVSVGFQRRYFAQNLVVKDILDLGTLGSLNRIVLNEGGRITRSGGGGDYQILPSALGGGVTLNLASHGIDLAVWLTQALDFNLRDVTMARDVDVDLAVAASIELFTKKGLVEFQLNVTWLERASNTMEFHFDHGVLRCPIQPSDSIELLASNGRLVTHVLAANGATTSAQAICLEWRNMVHSLMDKTPQPISALSTFVGAKLMESLLEKKR